MIESETEMKPRFHHYDIEILLFMRCETGETELPHFLNSRPRSFELVGCYFHTNSFWPLYMQRQFFVALLKDSASSAFQSMCLPSA